MIDDPPYTEGGLACLQVDEFQLAKRIGELQSQIDQRKS
jgi:hypothetical protein